MNMDSILDSVKKQLGLTDEIDAFDDEIIMNINSALFVLTQLGVGPKEGFSIYGSDETYDDFLGDDTEKMPIVKTYLYHKTRLGFDPPTSTAVMECIKKLIEEEECRLSYMVDPKTTFEEGS
jgi:hypothetical protein